MKNSAMTLPLRKPLTLSATASVILDPITGKRSFSTIPAVSKNNFECGSDKPLS